MCHIKRIMRISCAENKSNEEVMEMAGYVRSLLKTIRKRKLQFLGAYKRSWWIRKQILGGMVYSTKSRVRQRTKYTDSLNKYIARK